MAESKLCKKCNTPKPKSEYQKTEKRQVWDTESEYKCCIACRAELVTELTKPCVCCGSNKGKIYKNKCGCKVHISCITESTPKQIKGIKLYTCDGCKEDLIVKDGLKLSSWILLKESPQTQLLLQ